MKTLAILALTFCLPVFADDLAIILDKDGGVTVDGKKLDGKAWESTLESAAGKCKEGRTSSLQLTISCAPETSAEAFLMEIGLAGKLGVWDIRVRVGSKTLPIPQPKEKNLSDTPDPRFEEVRVSFVQVGSNSTKSPDPETTPEAADPTTRKYWVRVGDGENLDFSFSDEGIDRIAKKVAERREKLRNGGKTETPTILDLGSCAREIAMQQLFPIIQALEDRAVSEIQFAALWPFK